MKGLSNKLGVSAWIGRPQYAFLTHRPLIITYLLAFLLTINSLKVLVRV